MERSKINVLIVNYNTQNLIDACIKSINKHTPNAVIYVFDNSDIEKFINSFPNVHVLDNTEGQIIDFNEWLKNFPEHEKSPIGKSNNYASSKHCISIQKAIDIIDDNVILMDSDVLVKADINELWDEECIYVGGYEHNRWHDKRLMPFLCFINTNLCKEYGIKYFDENRIVGLTIDGEKYDTGCSFYVDSERYKHREIDIFKYIKHFAQGSWKRKGHGEEAWLKRYSSLYNGSSNSNLDIFICTHKDFKQVVNNESYHVINNNVIDESKYPPGNKFYSEIMTFYYVADNFKLKDYVGFCHYRRYFSFMDNVPNMDEVFKENDVIIGKPEKYGVSVKQFYGSCHNVDDLDIVENIVKEKYPDYYNIFSKYMNQKMFIPCNMFIMKREDFLEYVEFIRGVLNEYLKEVGTDIYKRIEDNKDKYLKKNSPNNTVEYQYRLGGYLAERLTGVFICKHFKKARAYEIKITEKKY